MGTYLITGASSGIGKACAIKLTKDGHNVILVARNAKKMQTLLQEMPGENYCFDYDLNDMEHIKDIFNFSKEVSGKLDGMIYAAGINADIPFKGMSPEKFTEIMNINCGSFAIMGKFFSNRKYSNDNARIVTISSSASISCDKGMGLYSASKAAMNSLVKTMSKEFIPRGILVNAVLPAGVLTPMAIEKIKIMTGDELCLDEITNRLSSQKYFIDISSEQPFGMILPHNLADIICYLISPSNRYITGALVPVSAGRCF